MFCGKCGAKNNDSAVFCAECGNRIAAAQPAAPAAPATTEAPATATGSKPGFTLNNRNIGIIAVAAVAALALIIGCFFIFGGRSYKDVVKDYFKATEKADAKLMMELLPDDLIKYVMKEEDMTRKEMVEDLQDSLDMIHRYYDDVKISYEITDTDDFDKDDLEDIKEDYKEIGVKVKDAMVVEVEVTMELDGNERTTTQELTLIKVGGSWYLDIEDVF